MKKFFKLFVINSISGAEKIGHNKFFYINIDRVELIDRQKNHLIIGNGIVLDIGSADGDEWAEFINAVDGYDENTFGPDPDTEIRNAVDAGRWLEFINSVRLEPRRNTIQVGDLYFDREETLIKYLDEKIAGKNSALAEKYDGIDDFNRRNWPEPELTNEKLLSAKRWETYMRCYERDFGLDMAKRMIERVDGA